MKIRFSQGKFACDLNDTNRSHYFAQIKNKTLLRGFFFFFFQFFKFALRIMKQSISEAEETVLVTLKLEEAVN